MTLTKLGFTFAASAILLTACGTTTQMTSGTDYLARYKASPTHAASGAIDEQVRSIASIEPDLRFPARIGLARIQNGQLTTAPGDEMQAWGDLADKLGAPYGEFVPVSPFIAAMVRPAPEKLEQKYYNRPEPNRVVADIRRASARQHLDYVLVYEVSQNSTKESNALSLADLTVLGLYVLPSRSVKIDSTASALLIDVRNGYPYGTATAFATDKQVRTVLGSGAARRRAEGKNFYKAVENLTSEVEAMMKDLWVLQVAQK